MGRNSFAAISECPKSVNLQLRSERRICYSELQAMRNRQTPYLRKAEPPAIRMTRRDRQILETIFAFDGMMSLKQIDRLFFSGTGGTWPRERLRALFDNGYLNMPDRDNMHRVPPGETIYFLGKKGAAIVAGLQGGLPKDLPWRRQPRRSAPRSWPAPGRRYWPRRW